MNPHARFSGGPPARVADQPGIVRFGVFEVHLAAGEMRKNGSRVKLQEQPFQVLVTLLKRPGEIVTRKELEEKLWADDTFVDFDHSLSTAVNKIREALGDSATSPRFIETVPRKGYPFIGGTAMAQGGAVELPSEAPKNAIEGRWCGTWALAGTALALAAFGVGKWQGQTTGSSASNGPVPFVSSRGSEEFPAFSLEVAKVAFPWSGTAGDNIDIYVQVVGSSHLFRLSRNPATGQWRATGSLTATRAYDSLTGAALEFLTVDQVNLGLPRSLAGRGDVEVALSEDGKAANRVRVNVR